MKQDAKPQNLQLNLPLLNLRPAELPQDKERELAQALAELLLSAALEGTEQHPAGGDDERKANR